MKLSTALSYLVLASAGLCSMGCSLTVHEHEAPRERVYVQPVYVEPAPQPRQVIIVPVREHDNRHH